MNFEPITIVSPHNQKILKVVSSSTSVEIDLAVQQSREVYRAWSCMPLEKRLEYMQKLYDAFYAYRDEIAKSVAMEIGMPISVAMKIDIDLGLEYLQGYIDHAQRWLEPEVLHQDEHVIHKLYAEPYGLVGASIPWNYPFCNFIWAVAANMIVGNTVVIKHAAQCTQTAQLLESIMLNAGMVPNVCNFVYGAGDVGSYLMQSEIDMIWFTGSTQTGSKVYQIAAQKNIPAILELGGSAPGIIFADADLDQATESVMLYRFLNSGQTCDGLKRLIVHESIFDDVVNRLVVALQHQKIGNPLDLKIQIGPLVTQQQLQTAQGQLDDALKQGARVIYPAVQLEGLVGNYMAPTILTNVTSSMRVWTEEVFAPILPIVAFATQQEAVQLANSTRYGLGAYIFAQNQKVIAEISAQLKTGNVSVNGANYVISQVPFGGYKASGIGRIHGRLGMRNLCLIKAVSQAI